MNVSLRSWATRAFTLTEMMVTSSLTVVVLGAVLGSHLFGVRMSGLTKAKLGASDEARRALDKLVEEIRTAKLLRLGSGTMSTFTEVSPNALQQGNSIQVYLSTNMNNYIRYYWDTNDAKLKRTTNGSTAVSIVANSITNSLVFTSEDFRGNVITNNQNNRVIGLTMQFYQIQYPIVAIGPGNYYDFYQLRTKITRRALE